MSEHQSPQEKFLELLQSDDPVVKIEALETLYNVKLNEEIIDSVCDCLSDADKGVRNSAVNFLIQSRSTAVAAKVVKLISAKEISVRNLAGEVLLRLGDYAVQALVNAIPEGDDDDKKFAVDVLGLIGNANAAPVILALMKGSYNENVLLACIEALGNLKSSESVSSLVELYDNNELFQPTIIEAMGKIDSPQSLGFVMAKYHCNDEYLKFSVIESLGIIGNESTFYFLLSEVSEIESPLAWPLIRSIYQLKKRFGLEIPFDEKMKNLILNALTEADVEYKKVATYLISAFEDKDILCACLKIYGEDFEIDEILKDKFCEYPTLILRNVSELINNSTQNLKSIISLIKELLEMYNPNGNDVLSELEFRNLSEAFTKCLENPDEEVRILSYELLFSFDTDTALLFSDVMAEDQSVWNRLRLLELLDGIHHLKVEDVLKFLTNDPDEMVSERATDLLSQNSFQSTD